MRADPWSCDPGTEPIEIRKFFAWFVHSRPVDGNMGGMKKRLVGPITAGSAWQLARSGDYRGGLMAASAALARIGRHAPPQVPVEMHLVAAFCAMRQGHHSEALRELDAADHAALLPEADAGLRLRVRTWRAELAYFQGRNSAALEIVDEVLEPLERSCDWAYAAFAMRIRIAILIARTDYDGVADLADRAVRAAEASGDDYVMVQILNVLGAYHFDRATSRLSEPHARSHLSLLDPRDAAPMESEAREALRFFERAREVAERARYEFAAWYVAGNIERLEILLGHAERAVRAIRKRLKVLQARGAKYDEIVTRSNLAWGLRTLGRHREALHELDVALDLARRTGTFNVLLEFLHYDRSIVLDALGDSAGARASYRRYVRLVGAGDGAPEDIPAATGRRPLEPHFLKRADRFLADHAGEAVAVHRLARHCGVSPRTLEKAFADFRGITPVAHARNVRLDSAHKALAESDESVPEIAERHGFRSPTTFALEYRKRFGISPRQRKRDRRKSTDPES